MSVGWGALPTATLLASPNVISGGQSSIFEWTTLAGSALDSLVDWGVDTAGAASGSVSATPPGTRTCRLLVATKEGGALATETICVDEMPPGETFADGVESGSTSAWSAATPWSLIASTDPGRAGRAASG